ncbi:hypothetical protein RS030_192913 [Cryptosporidium xiaoi]|uniref:Uncharacterized protein n=1 Tax=Cryptosporidium xiaoi TaxID=659607 RepID=A0AAV9Y026_9CRYT
MMKNNLLILLCFYSLQLFVVKDSLLKNGYSDLFFKNNDVTIPFSLLKTRPRGPRTRTTPSSLLLKGFPGLNPKGLFEESELASSLKVKLSCDELQEIQEQFSELFNLFLSILEQFYANRVSTECLLELDTLAGRCKSKKRKHMKECEEILKAKKKVDAVNRDYERLESKMNSVTQTLVEIDEEILKLLVNCVASFIEVSKKKYDRITGSVGFVYKEASKLNDFIGILNFVNKAYCHAAFYDIMRLDTNIKDKRVSFAHTLTTVKEF